MQEINDIEINMISGADAAATRLPGTNSWGENVDPYRPLGDCLENVRENGGGVFGVLRCFWIHGR